LVWELIPQKPRGDGTEFRTHCNSVGLPIGGMEGGWYGSGSGAYQAGTTTRSFARVTPNNQNTIPPYSQRSCEDDATTVCILHAASPTVYIGYHGNQFENLALSTRNLIRW